MESEFISLEEFASDSEDRPGTWGEREPVLLLTPPWVGRDDYAHRDFTVSLHNEILDFWDWAGPNPTRHAQRQRVLSRITHILQDVFPEGRLHVFGSFGLGVYLESGDVDLVLELPENSQAHPLSRIKSEFLRKDFVSFIEVIDGASVPIVKFDAKEEQISGDICVNNMSGVHALEFFREKLAQFPCMKFLLLVLKQFVKSRNLNETFHGGIGSFLLQNMLLAFLQGFYKRARFENETPDQFFNRTNLGILLIAFFQYFSLEHNYVTVGIDTRGAGVLKPKVIQRLMFGL
jgi:non-canonical poly(A) RNA polymerase PAPD5/7